MKAFLGLLPLWLPAILCADDPVTYADHVLPIFRQHCLKCHGDDEHKADLSLQTFEAAAKGGSGGLVLVAGRSSQSLLFQSITDPEDDARMPPNKPPLPQEQIEIIRKWIDTGLRESATSESMVAARDTSFQPTAKAGAKPDQPVMPQDLPDIEVPPTVRPLPVLAMDSSPWAPLVAVAAHAHIRLLHAETREELGRLPFPEGVPHVLRFSRDGAVLLAAGGQPVQAGRAVLYDVRTGNRLATVGDELDAVLAADLSPDQKLVALGGSGKVVKVYPTSGGPMAYKIEKHTDWITAVAFSPDGTKLATADRAGGLHLWEASGGAILLSLSEHKTSIRAIDWRPDGKLLASAAEDGRVIWWDVTDGWPVIDKGNAHPPARPPGTFGFLPNGVLAARFDPSGFLATAGRDRTVQVWTPTGEPFGRFKVEGGLPVSTTISHDGSSVFAGDSAGIVQSWPLPKR